jgi:hypothetical protein
MADLVKLVVFVPEANADAVRQALGEAGAGKLGNYVWCSFSSKGLGRFLPEEGASPAIGQVGVFETVSEERIEVTCEKSALSHIVAAMKAAHPYEEVAYDLYPLIDLNE